MENDSTVEVKKQSDGTVNRLEPMPSVGEGLFYVTVSPMHDKAFPAYDSGDRWNGFACPLFTFRQARQFARAYAKVSGQFARYDAASETWTFVSGEGAEPDRFESTMRDGRKVWPIGAYCWTWKIVGSS